MKSERYLRKYNHLNGKPVSHSTLERFHNEINKELDSKRIDASSPGGLELIAIARRIGTALKKFTGTVRMALKPVDVNKILKTQNLGAKKTSAQSIAEKHRKKIEAQNKKMPKPIRDILNGTGCLHGLEQVQNDSHLGSMSDSTYQVITDKILELLKSDGLIWRKPWNAKVNGPASLAHNHITKTVYRGANFYLNYLLLKFNSSKFFTFKQVEELGGKVRKGEEGWPVVYFKYLYKRNNELVDEKEALDINGRLKKGYTEVPALFYYKVFNLNQTEGLKIKEPPQNPKNKKEIIESAESIIKEMPKKPPIKNGPQAFYSPSKDYVEVPTLDHFKIDQHYYSVLFHELIHSTGHRKRVGRAMEGRFGSKPYAFEELIAELGASYLCGESGILYFTIKNSAAYIKNWSTRLKKEMSEDPRFFLRAASEAQKAADFMLARGEFHDLKKIEKSPKNLVKKEAPKKVAIKKNVVHKKAGILSGADIASMNFNRINLNGPWKIDLGSLYSDEQMMFYGQPGSGKSVYILRLANYLAKDLKLNGLYVANEELGRSSFTEKINQFKINVPNLHFTKTLKNIDLKPYHFVVLDSVNSLGMTLHDYKALRQSMPDKIYILVVQSTKDGDFRGGKDWEHEMDFSGELVDRALIVHKNRYDSDFNKKREAFLVNQKIKEEATKKMIKQKVKEVSQPPQLQII